MTTCLHAYRELLCTANISTVYDQLLLKFIILLRKINEKLYIIRVAQHFFLLLVSYQKERFYGSEILCADTPFTTLGSD